MLSPLNFIKCVVLLVLLCGGGMAKRKRKISVSDWNKVSHDDKGAGNDTGRGLFFRGEYNLEIFDYIFYFYPST